MTNDKTNKKLTLKEEIGLIRRAVKIWNIIQPKFWVYHVLCILAETFSPYFGLYMSAQLLNELAGDCDGGKLLALAGITAFGGFLSSTIIKLLQSKRTMKDYREWNRHEAFMIDAQNDMQYEHLENPDVVLLRSKIFAVLEARGSGLIVVKWALDSILNDILNIIFSFSLTVSMFTMAAEGEFKGMFAFINSPVSAFLIAVLILISAFFRVYISNREITELNETYGEMAHFNTFYDSIKRLYGSDMIVFNLNRIVLDEFRKHSLRPKWVIKAKKIAIKYKFPVNDF